MYDGVDSPGGGEEYRQLQGKIYVVYECSRKNGRA